MRAFVCSGLDPDLHGKQDDQVCAAVAKVPRSPTVRSRDGEPLTFLPWRDRFVSGYKFVERKWPKEEAMRLIASFENPPLGAGGNPSLEEYDNKDGYIDMSAVCERYKTQRAEQNSTKGQEGVDKRKAREENRVGAGEEAKNSSSM